MRYLAHCARRAILLPWQDSVLAHPPPALSLANVVFKGLRARALFAGLAAHSMLPLERLFTAGFGLVLGVAGHAVGWPMPRGGSQKIADALGHYLQSIGGEIVTGASGHFN